MAKLATEMFLMSFSLRTNASYNHRLSIYTLGGADDRIIRSTESNLMGPRGKRVHISKTAVKTLLCYVDTFWLISDSA